MRIMIHDKLRSVKHIPHKNIFHYPLHPSPAPAILYPTQHRDVQT
nr:MAG TPA: hypothetical protein [Caudoviricetes sp.]